MCRMAPKRKAATASSTKDTADAPQSKRKKTEVPEDGPAEVHPLLMQLVSLPCLGMASIPLSLA